MELLWAFGWAEQILTKRRKRSWRNSALPVIPWWFVSAVAAMTAWLRRSLGGRAKDSRTTMQGCLLLYITNLSTDITDRTIENSSIHNKPQLLATKQTYLSKGAFPVVSFDFWHCASFSCELITAGCCCARLGLLRWICREVCSNWWPFHPTPEPPEHHFLHWPEPLPKQLEGAGGNFSVRWVWLKVTKLQEICPKLKWVERYV